MIAQICKEFDLYRREKEISIYAPATIYVELYDGVPLILLADGSFIMVEPFVSEQKLPTPRSIPVGGASIRQYLLV